MGRLLCGRTFAAGSAFAASIFAGLALLAGPAIAAEDLVDMSLEDLMNVEVTSVSRKAQSKTETAAAVTVISSEDLRRGGFTSVPEALRTVPGVQVARIDASRWAISIRGFLQEFSNKLLVMIDGRSIYTPLFGGVVWNEQNLAIADIERIEVIRGPGGTIWGANAVNGVINIISKKAADTQGVHAHVLVGTRENGLAGRFGGAIGDHTQYRISANGEKVSDFDFDQSYNGEDEWGQLRLGVRSDSKLSENDDLTILLDYFDVDREGARGIASGVFPFPIVGFRDEHYQQRGGDAVVQYGHDFEGGSRLEAKAYYDEVSRRTTLKEDSRTFDVELQHDIDLLENLGVIWGVDYRYWTTHTKPGTGTVVINPNDETFHLGSGFVQLQLDLFEDRVSLIGGTKLSVNNWSGFEYQPSGRVVVRPVEGHTTWAAVSRAVRVPTLIDRDLQGNIGPITIQGDRNFTSEELLSVELGYRFHQLDWLAAEISAFYSFYDEDSALVGTGPGELTFGNRGDIQVRGAEVELTLIPADWWRIVSGYSVLDYADDDLVPNPLVPGKEKNSNPRHQFTFRSLFDLPCDLEFDASLYYVDGLPDVTPVLRSNNVRHYVRLDLRLGWKPLDWLEVSVVGQNLTDARHAEFNDVQRNMSTQVPRSGYAKMTFDF